MKLYEINAEIQRLADQIDFDPETGEILMDADAIFEEIGKLKLERQSILEYLAKLVINTRADIEAVKAEEARLKDRRIRLSTKENRLMKVLDRDCGVKKTDLGIATFSYRQNSHLEVSDAEKAIRWLKRHKYKDCYRTPAPKVAKAEVKKLINAGEKVPGCAIVQDYSCLLK